MKNPSKLQIAAVEYCKSFGNRKAIADHFNVKPGQITSWLNFGKFPQEVYDEMYEAALNGLTTVAVEEPLPEWVNEAPEVESTEAVAPTTLDDIKNMLLDLHRRVENVESGNVTTPGPLSPEEAAGQKVPHSGVRPPSAGGQRSALKAAGIVDPGLPQRPEKREVGIGTGIAPSRAEANASAGGERGNPAGPAKVRRQIQQGDPGWNGRVKDAKGNVIAPGWNDAKPKMQVMAVPVGAAWPVSR